MVPLRRKVVRLLGSVFAVLTFNFFLFHIIPGDPVRLIARSQRLSPEAVQELRRQFGLDGSMAEQYWRYLVNLAHGDLGFSYTYHSAAAPVIGRALEHTVLLLTVSTLLVVGVGILLGVRAGSRPSSRTDTSIVMTSLVLWSLPTFWVGMLLVFAFGVWTAVLPISGITTPDAVYANGFGVVADVARHLVLPTITLAAVDIAFFVMVTRTAVIDVMGEDYMLTARGKGLPRRTIIWRHAVRNSLLPVLTASAMYISALVAGAIQVEVVFSWPGMGLLMYNSVLSRDYPVLEACFLVASVAVLVANFATDLLYRFLDPRVAVPE